MLALDLGTGAWGAVEESFSAPRAVAVDEAGNLYVADTDADRVQVRDAATGAWATVGADRLSRPSGVAVDSDGRVVVADTGNDRIVRFHAHGAAQASWGSRGVGNGELVGPQGVAADGSGRVLVTDEFNNRLQIFAPTGSSAQARSVPAPPPRPAAPPGPEPPRLRRAP